MSSVAPSTTGDSPAASRSVAFAGGREGLRRQQRALHLRGNLLAERHVRRVAGEHRHDMPDQRNAQQGEVAEDVEHLVPDEFVRVAQGLGGEHGIVADDDRVLQAAPLDEAVLDQVLDLLVEAKRAGVREFAAPRLRRDFEAEVLGVTPPAVRARAGEFEPVMREDRHLRFAGLELEGLRHGVTFARLALGHEARFVHHAAILARAAVGNGRFVGVELDDGVVHAAAGEGGQHVFDGLHFDRAVGERGRAVGFGHVFQPGRDFGLPFEIDPPEPDAAAGGRREELHVHPVPAVQADAGKADWAAKSLLLNHARGLNERPRALASGLSDTAQRRPAAERRARPGRRPRKRN